MSSSAMRLLSSASRCWALRSTPTTTRRCVWQRRPDSSSRGPAWTSMVCRRCTTSRGDPRGHHSRAAISALRDWGARGRGLHCSSFKERLQNHEFLPQGGNLAREHVVRHARSLELCEDVFCAVAVRKDPRCCQRLQPRRRAQVKIDNPERLVGPVPHANLSLG